MSRQDQANKRQSDGQIEEEKPLKARGGEANRRASLPSDMRRLRVQTPQEEKRRENEVLRLHPHIHQVFHRGH